MGPTRLINPQALDSAFCVATASRLEHTCRMGWFRFADFWSGPPLLGKTKILLERTSSIT